MTRIYPDDITYTDAPHNVRDDLVEAHRQAWRHIAGPGTWLDGATRVAIAAETRHAAECGLCRDRKAALSPNAVSGTHDNLGPLSPAMVEVIHRVATDPGRLSREWYRSVRADGLEETHYVEAVGIVGIVKAVDGFARGMGLAPLPLPEPEAGDPTRNVPAGAVQGPAWVRWTPPDNVTEAEAGLYDHGTSNVTRALSLVPASAMAFFNLVLAQYLPGTAAMRDFANEYRAITHGQIELLAARVSALNQCVY